MAVPLEIEPVPTSKDEYHRLDYRVMALVFDLHNDLGRLWGEKLYQSELAARCQDRGMRAGKEVPPVIAHKGFEKTYFIDLVVEDRILYELKTADVISPLHRQQTPNYLLLSGFRYGKLVNMRPPSVQAEYVTTTLTPEERHRFEVFDDDWADLGERSMWLRELVIELLSDWGAFLDMNLYREAIAFFQGGDECVATPVAVTDNGRVLGTQTVHLLTPETAIHLSAIKQSQRSYEKHLERFLSHTPLRAVHWVNFDRHKICMKTVLK